MGKVLGSMQHCDSLPLACEPISQVAETVWSPGPSLLHSESEASLDYKTDCLKTGQCILL